MRRKLCFILTFTLALTACSGDPWRGMYEGTRSRNESLKKPEERAATPQSPSYDQYKKERERLEHDGDTSSQQ